MYREPKWGIDALRDAIIHFKGGDYEPFEPVREEDSDIVIPAYYIPELVQFLTDKGYIRPQMSKESREEDTKIIHRLLDLCEKKIK